jgi:hypothetical protein
MYTPYNSLILDVNSTSVNALYDCCELSEINAQLWEILRHEHRKSIVRAIEITYCKCWNEIDDLIDVRQWEKPIK